MLWKALSIFAALLLAGGAYFANINRGVHSQEKEMLERSKNNLKAVKAELDTIATAKTKATEELTKATASLETTKKEVEKFEAENGDELKAAEIQKKLNEERTKQLAQLEEQIRKAGDLKNLIAEVAKLNKEKDESAALVANKEQQRAFADEKVKQAQSDIVRMTEVQKRMRTGVIEPGFTARVLAPFNDFGYVVLNKGNVAGMIANATLHVKRGRNIVATLKVRDVEQSSSVADVVPGTLASGASIRAGDLVVAAPAAATPPAPSTAPAADGTAPAPTPDAGPGAPPAGMAPPSMDPFGGAPAPAPAGGTPPAAPAGADPFAPAPAPAPAGAAPAPAAPAAPAGADPFAPAPPAAGAPPAPTAPPGADPFAPAPPKQ